MSALPQIENEEQRRKLQTQLQQLRAHPGWKIIEAYLGDLKAKKETAIFQVGGNEIKYTVKDLLIVEHDIIDYLLKLPLSVIDELMPPQTGEVEELDAFSDAT